MWCCTYSVIVCGVGSPTKLTAKQEEDQITFVPSGSQLRTYAILLNLVIPASHDKATDLYPAPVDLELAGQLGWKVCYQASYWTSSVQSHNTNRRLEVEDTDVFPKTSILMSPDSEETKWDSCKISTKKVDLWFVGFLSINFYSKVTDVFPSAKSDTCFGRFTSFWGEIKRPVITWNISG